MKIKEAFIIFFLGLIVGVVVSPLALTKPEEAFVSPVSVTLAQTQNYYLPVSESEVLSSMVTDTSEQPSIKMKPEITFGEIITEEEELSSVGSDNLDNEESVKEEGGSSEVKTTLNVENNREVENEGVTPLSNHSGSLTIAVLGDSMVDTMGPGLPYIEKALKKYYPNYFFNLLNYGAGATNIEYGIQRLTQDYEYLGKTVPSLVSTKPDIVIVESLAYNPWGAEKSDLDRHWLSMAKIVDVLKTQTQAKILLFSTIAPNKANFGAGPAGVNWDKGQAWQHAEKINLYLENTLRFAASQNLPVVDAYHPSQVNGDGNLVYINPGDHIHPSVAGCEFVAELIAKKLINLGWIN